MNRILIVEDEVPIAQLIEMSLARAGYQCEAVNDGCAAADKIEQNDYDLVPVSYTHLTLPTILLV